MDKNCALLFGTSNVWFFDIGWNNRKKTTETDATSNLHMLFEESLAPYQ